MQIEIFEKTTIEQIFSHITNQKLIFSIPRYQRDYSWRKKQWEEFFFDVKRSFSMGENETDYWGSIIVHHDKNNKEYEIIDGQQRMVTILILALAAGKVYTPEEKIPLKLQDDKKELWSKITTAKKLTKVETRSTLWQAKKFFEKSIEKDKIDKNKFREYILKTQITLAIIDNEFESNLLFGRLNTRGIRLSDVDLIKHKIFYEVEKNSGPTNNDVVLDCWKQIQSKLNSINENLTIEIFLPLWWETKQDVIDKTLYESFNDELKENQYVEFLNDLLNTATKIDDWKCNSSGNDNKIGRNLKWLLKISLSSSPKIMNIIIAMANIVFDKKLQIDLIELLTLFEFTRKMTLLKEEGFPGEKCDYSSLDEAYVQFSKKISTVGVSENEIKEEIKQLKIKLSENIIKKEVFETMFSELRHNDKQTETQFLEEKMLSTYAIYTLNNWRDIENRGAGAEFRTKDDDEYSIEHIIAKKKAGNIESPEYRIGNLMVLEKSINEDLKDKELSEKITKYKKSSYPQVQEFIFKNKRLRGNRKKADWKKEEFGDAQIEERGYYLADCFYERIENLLKINKF